MNKFDDDEEINKQREWNVNKNKLKRWLFVSLFVDSFQTFIELKAKSFLFPFFWLCFLKWEILEGFSVLNVQKNFLWSLRSFF
jgi:hypothetical protein